MSSLFCFSLKQLDFRITFLARLNTCHYAVVVDQIFHFARVIFRQIIRSISSLAKNELYILFFYFLYRSLIKTRRLQTETSHKAGATKEREGSVVMVAVDLRPLSSTPSPTSTTTSFYVDSHKDYVHKHKLY